MTTLEITAPEKEGLFLDTEKTLRGLEREGRLLRAEQDISIAPMPQISEVEKNIDYMTLLDETKADDCNAFLF